MKILCKVLGCATVLLGLYVWLQTPHYMGNGEPPSTIGYTATAIGCLIGGILWFAIAKILENQELIMEHFNILKSKK